jgi:DNA topoisomerase-1|tara:strand:- start:1150 stop:2442 length:1293 start_codon:yes stop_codon:yes gene_type:complete
MKAEDSGTSAEKAGLILSDREEAGITREKVETPSEEEGGSPTISWDYHLPNRKILSDEERVGFLNSLAVPPAWTEVWFCPNENGHIQATGKDANGRLQYRYHPKWNEYKSILKYQNVDEFAIALNELRRRVDSDLGGGPMDRAKVVAIVVRLIDRYHIRVGSDQYAQENESYGLTTLQEGHVKFWKGKKAIDGDIDAVLNFTGKSGKEWKLLIKDDQVAKLIEESGKVGGKEKTQDLFRYLDDNGNDYDIKAEHINDYLEEHMDHRYTAKDFRTWAASWKTAARLAMVSEASENQINKLPKLHKDAVEESEKSGFPPYLTWAGRTLKGTEGLAKLAEAGKLPGDGENERNATILAVIDTVAADLGNTRAVCRSSYIRPMFMNDWESGIFMDRWEEAKSGKKRGRELIEDENTAINYMRTHEDDEFQFSKN